jgi:hypothetical protein
MAKSSAVGMPNPCDGFAVFGYGKTRSGPAEREMISRVVLTEDKILVVGIRN